MLIKFEKGDMFKSDADCLINTVNCEGYMGKGIAYQFKLQFPENNISYVKACKSGELRIGTIHYFVEKGITIINFPTKDKWRESSKLKYIEVGLDVFLNVLPSLRVKTIAIPPLGCGNGGLEWAEVKELILKKIVAIEENYTFLIYEPSKGYKQKAKKAPKLSASSLVLMKIKMNLKYCSKLRLQKTAYLMDLFMGEHYFSFSKYKYGPYAHSIDVICRDIREYQSYYNLKDTESTFQMVYQIICSDKTLAVLDKLTPVIEKASSYVNKIENDQDLEGIASVLYLIENGDEMQKDKLISEFKGWSEDKASRFTIEQIEAYIGYLVNTGLIERNLTGSYCISEYI